MIVCTSCVELPSLLCQLSPRAEPQSVLFRTPIGARTFHQSPPILVGIFPDHAGTWWWCRVVTGHEFRGLTTICVVCWSRLGIYCALFVVFGIALVQPLGLAWDPLSRPLALGSNSSCFSLIISTNSSFSWIAWSNSSVFSLRVVLSCCWTSISWVFGCCSASWSW